MTYSGTARQDARKLLALNLERFRRLRGLSKIDLSRMSGVSRPKVDAVIEGTQSVGIDVLEALAAALDVEIAYLLFPLDGLAFEERETVDRILNRNQGQGNLKFDFVTVSNAPITTANRPRPGQDEEEFQTSDSAEDAGHQGKAPNPEIPEIQLILTLLGAFDQSQVHVALSYMRSIERARGHLDTGDGSAQFPVRKGKL